MDGLIDGCIDEQMDGQIEGWMMDRQMDGRMDGQEKEQTAGLIIDSPLKICSSVLSPFLPPAKKICLSTPCCWSFHMEMAMGLYKIMEEIKSRGQRQRQGLLMKMLIMTMVGCPL